MIDWPVSCYVRPLAKLWRRPRVWKQLSARLVQAGPSAPVKRWRCRPYDGVCVEAVLEQRPRTGCRHPAWPPDVLRMFGAYDGRPETEHGLACLGGRIPSYSHRLPHGLTDGSIVSLHLKLDSGALGSWW